MLHEYGGGNGESESSDTTYVLVKKEMIRTIGEKLLSALY